MDRDFQNTRVNKSSDSKNSAPERPPQDRLQRSPFGRSPGSVTGNSDMAGRAFDVSNLSNLAGIVGNQAMLGHINRLIGRRPSGNRQGVIQREVDGVAGTYTLAEAGVEQFLPKFPVSAFNVSLTPLEQFKKATYVRGARRSKELIEIDNALNEFNLKAGATTNSFSDRMDLFIEIRRLERLCRDYTAKDDNDKLIHNKKRVDAVLRLMETVRAAKDIISGSSEFMNTADFQKAADKIAYDKAFWETMRSGGSFADFQKAVRGLDNSFSNATLYHLAEIKDEADKKNPDGSQSQEGKRKSDELRHTQSVSALIGQYKYEATKKKAQSGGNAVLGGIMQDISGLESGFMHSAMSGPKSSKVGEKSAIGSKYLMTVGQDEFDDVRGGGIMKTHDFDEAVVNSESIHEATHLLVGNTFNTQGTSAYAFNVDDLVRDYRSTFGLIMRLAEKRNRVCQNLLGLLDPLLRGNPGGYAGYNYNTGQAFALMKKVTYGYVGDAGVTDIMGLGNLKMQQRLDIGNSAGDRVTSGNPISTTDKLDARGHLTGGYLATHKKLSQDIGRHNAIFASRGQQGNLTPEQKASYSARIIAPGSLIEYDPVMNQLVYILAMWGVPRTDPFFTAVEAAALDAKRYRDTYASTGNYAP